MTCTPSIEVIDLVHHAELVLDDCSGTQLAALLNREEAMLVAAALDAAAMYLVKTEVLLTSGQELRVQRIEDAAAKTVVELAIKNGPWYEVAVGPVIAQQRASQLRAAF